MSTSTITSNIPPSVKSGLPKPGKPSAIGMGFNGIFAVGDAYNRISNGEKVVPSIAKAVGTALVQDTVMGLMGPVATGIAMVGSIAMVGGSLAIESGKASTQSLAGAMGGSAMKNKHAINSNNAVTMRQRGMAMINQAGETQRSVLGNEARAYVRGNMY